MEHTDERRPSIMTLPPVTVGGWHCKVHFLKPMDYLLSMILGTPVTIGGYRIVTQHLRVEDRSPKSWQLLGSEDDSNWTTVLHSVSNEIGWTAWEGRNYLVSSPNAYQYYKFVFTEATGENTYLGIAEIEFISFL